MAVARDRIESNLGDQRRYVDVFRSATTTKKAKAKTKINMNDIKAKTKQELESIVWSLWG